MYLSLAVGEIKEPATLKTILFVSCINAPFNLLHRSNDDSSPIDYYDIEKSTFCIGTVLVGSCEGVIHTYIVLLATQQTQSVSKYSGGLYWL